MFETIKNMFVVKDIRKKILYTIFIILLFRIGTFITVPGINKLAFMEAFKAQSNGILGTINIISGGAFSRLSIFAMTISPYITASIVLQLLQTVIPSLEKLAKEGETGRKKLGKYTKMLTMAFAIVEAIGLYLNYRTAMLPALSVGAMKAVGMIMFVLCMTAGTALLMWLADKITEYGIGNGVSMIIFVGIVSGAPRAITALAQFTDIRKLNILIVVVSTTI